MDEKEREDRMAAAEALFMISHRGEKPQLPSRPRPTRRGKKQKVVDYDDITATKGKADTQTSKSRSRSLAKSNESANLLNERGRGRRGGSGSRGRGRGRVKAQNNSRRDRSYDGEPDNSQSIAMETENSTSPDSFDEEIPKPLKGKSKRKGGKTKARATKAQRKTSVASDTISAELKEPIDLAATKSDRQDTKDTSIIIYRPSESQQTSPSGNLPSLGLVSGFKQVSLATKSSTTTETTILPSFNLSEGNLLPSINLPSLPAELPFLQLPSQPTPNLSSLGDVVQPIDVDSQPDRGKSEKFLPLKKRKLHKTEESAGTPTTVAADSPVDGSSVSDTEERYDAVSPEPPRSPFTVQAPPIITMNTLMEIKTALQPDDDGDLPLHIAVVHENMRMVAKLISLMRIAGKHVDKFNKQQQTPLHLAIKLDFTEAVELLLKFGADVNAVDCSGSSAIHMAVQGRSTPILRLLLEKCPLAQLNNRNIEGLTPLHTAVDNGDLEQVDLLLSYGADIDVTDGKSGRTPLFRAAESNHKPMVELLLKRGANVDVQSYAGVTVSMAAQGRNLHGVLKLLGSIQDKFGLALDTNSNSSSNKTPQHTPSPLLYVGFPSSSKASATSTGPDGTLGQYMVKATSSSSLTSSSSSSFAPSQQLQQRQEASQRLTGVTYLIRPQSKMERADKTSGGIMLERADSRETMFEETKVFHNVFMFPDEETKKRIHHDSRSEPSSPDTCTSVDKLIGSQRKEKGKVALLSLPDNLDIGGETIKRSFTSLPSSSLQQNVVESKSSRAATVIRKVTVGSPKPPGSPQRESVAGNFVGRISSDGVLHLVPSVTVTSISSSPSAPFSCSSSPTPLIAFHPSKSRVTASCLAPSIVLPILSSAVSSPLLPASPSVLSSLSPKAGPTLQQENDSTAASQATSSLTSVQAKLYETLLRRTQSIPGSPGVVLPAQPSSPGARLMSQVLLSPLQSSSGSSSTLGNVSYRVIPNSSSNPPLVESLAVRRDAPTMVPLLMTPSFTHALKSGSSSLRSSPPNTPLNLSKPSLSRQFQDSTDKSETAANSDFDKASTDQTQIGTIQAGTGVMMSENRSSKEQGGPSETQARKIISVGMRKITNGEKSVSSVLPVASTGASFQTQYEMFLLPEKQQSDQARGASPVSGNSVVDSSNDNTRSQLQQQQMSLMSAQTVPLVCTMNPRKHSKSVADILTSVDVSTLPKMGSSNNSNLSTVSGPSIVLDPTALATMSKGDLIVPSFPHISKCVSPATAFIVRDLLSRQNQLLHKPTSSASESMSSASPISSASSLGLVTSIPASPIAHQAAGRIIIPPQGAQNNIVGLSGAILSVIPGSAMSGILSASTTQESKQSHHLQDHQKPASSSSQKEHHPRKSRASKGSSKGQKVDRSNSDADISSPSVSASSSGYPIPKLSKINSETDQKLKKFLVAKRQEVLMSNWQGDDSSSQRLEAEEESLEALEDGSSLNTVGIFSGNVQRIRLGKVKVPLSSSAQADVNSCPLVPSTMPQTASSPSVQDVLSSTPSTPSDSLPPLVIVTSSGLQTDGETRSSSPPSATPMISDPSVYSRVSSTSVIESTAEVRSEIGHKNSAAEVSCETCHWNSETRVNSETGHRHRVVPQMEEDKEEPMEVDLPNSAVSSAPTSNGTMTPNSVSTSTSSGAPPNVVSADSISLKSNVQIVIQSPTPPPPVSDPSGRS